MCKINNKKKIFSKAEGYKYADLLKSGLDHIRSSNVLFKKDPICYDSAGYLAQLGIELFLKAILLKESNEFPAEHNLLKLNALVEKHSSLQLLKEDKKCLKKLYDYYQLRYVNPNNPIEIGDKDWELIENIANRLLSYFPENVINTLDKTETGYVIKGNRILMMKPKNEK